MKYASGVETADPLGASGSPSPMFDDDVGPAEHRYLGTGGGEPSSLLPWIDDPSPSTPAPTPTPTADPDQGLRVSLKDREVRAGNPDDPSAAYFLASQKEQGARWRTSNGGFSGTIDKKGLNTRARLGERDQLIGSVDANRSGSLAWERDGKNVGELYGRAKSGTDSEGGVRSSWEVGDGNLTAGLRHQVTADGATDGAFAGYKSADGTTSLDGAAGLRKGQFVGNLGGSYKVSPQDTVTGSLSHDNHGTAGRLGGVHAWEGGSLSSAAELAQRSNGLSGSVESTYKNHGTTIGGRYAHTPERDALSVTGSQTVSPQLSVAGNLGYERLANGQGQGTIGLSERYRSDALVHGLDVNAGVGTQNFLSTTGSIDGRLGNQLYAGAWGNARIEEGKRTTGQAGASLTYLPSDNLALTASGVVNDRRQYEAQIELDFLKKGIGTTQDLVDRRKDSAFGMYLRYSQGGTNNLDDRYGAPTVSGSNGTISGGIRMKF